MEYEIIRINENSWRIENGGVRFFLLTGTQRALLIDSGMTLRNVRAIAEGLTSLPLTLLNTHADPDHMGCNDQFDTPYLHPAEFTHFEQRNPGKPHLALLDNAKIYLGGRWIEALLIPGHTCGSLALLDEERKYLFSGDMVSASPIFMFGPQRSMIAYYASLERLRRQSEFFEKIYPAHGPMPLEPEIITRLMDCCEAVLAGNVEPQDPPMPVPARLYSRDGVGFLLSAAE